MKSLAACLWVVVCAIAGTAAPSITGAGPNPIDAGGPYFPLTINGTGFVNGSVAYWGPNVLSTTHVSSTQLIAEISPDLRLIAGGYSIVVSNPDGTISAPYTIVVSPVLAYFNPYVAVAGSSPVTITIKGIGLSARIVPQISSAAGPVPLPSTFVDAMTVTAVIPASALSDARAATIRLIDPASGGVSGTLPFQVRATPAIESVAPNPVDAGGVYFELTVNGTGFSSGDLVNWSNGVTLGTTYVSATQLKAAVTPDLRTLAGAFPLTVTDPATKSTSNPCSFVVSPVLFSISPSSAATGGTALQMTAAGAGFTTSTALSMTVAGKQTALATTYVSPASLTATIPAGALAGSGTISIQVNDSAGGGHSLAQTLTVATAIPSIASLTPSAVTAGAGTFTLTIGGLNFTGAAAVLWNGSALPTTFASSTQLTAAVPAALVQTAGTASIRVSNGANAQSTAATFTVHALPPVLSAFTPSSAIAGSAAFTVTVTSANCGSGCAVQWNGANLVTTIVSPTSVTAAVPANLIAAPGISSIRLINAEGTVSSAVSFVINPPAATLSTVTPSSLTSGNSPITLTINGSGFAAAAQVLWNGAALATTFVNATQLSAVVPASLIGGALSAAITVSNPGGAVSNRFTVTINAPGPVIAALSPTSIPAAGGPFTLTVTGQNFAVNGVVRWNGSPLYTTVTGPTQATATVPADRIAAAGSASITLANPSGQESAAVAFAITAPLPAIAGLTPASAPAGSAALAISVSGKGFLSTSTVLWNGGALSTTFASPSQLKANVPAALLQVSGMASITVSTPGTTPAGPAVFTVGAPVPLTSTAGIVNAASGQSDIAPGSLISIYGANLASGSASAGQMPLPTLLNGTSVTIDGIPAPLIFVSSQQINAQVPFEVQSGGATLAVTAGTLRSSPVPFDVQPIAPGVLPVVLNCADGTVNSPQSSVQAGQYITLWMTGQGSLQAPIGTGQAAPLDPLILPLAGVQAQIGGQGALVDFVGMAPGLAGLLQVNLVVPDIPSGNQAAIITVGGVASNPVPVSVQ